MGKILGVGRARDHGDRKSNPALPGGWEEAVSLLDRQPVVAPDVSPVEAALRNALENDRLFLDYQPIFNASGKVVEIEALLRSRDPLLQKAGTSEYIRVAEESNLILAVGERVLLMACRGMTQWHDLGVHDVTLAVNVSCMQLVTAGFARLALALFEEHRIRPATIHMEITESKLARDTTSMLAEMTLLAEAGVCFSIDDFGTGYSTLERLSRLPVSTMKIDQSFVREIRSNERVFATVQGMVDLARHLGLEVIAEGVEMQEQLELLRSAGCTKFQGYLLGRPVGAPAMTDLLIANRSVGDPEYLPPVAIGL
ncbi:MAG TPA: EAL domain-containing protein [Acidobacteriaceae bacterium]|nr:EAL domain-containing protein [Acidobacteriaceae bacterium]